MTGATTGAVNSGAASNGAGSRRAVTTNVAATGNAGMSGPCSIVMTGIIATTGVESSTGTLHSLFGPMPTPNCDAQLLGTLQHLGHSQPAIIEVFTPKPPAPCALVKSGRGKDHCRMPRLLL